MFAKTLELIQNVQDFRYNWILPYMMYGLGNFGKEDKRRGMPDIILEYAISIDLLE